MTSSAETAAHAGAPPCPSVSWRAQRREAAVGTQEPTHERQQRTLGLLNQRLELLALELGTLVSHGDCELYDRGQQGRALGCDAATSMTLSPFLACPCTQPKAHAQRVPWQRPQHGRTGNAKQSEVARCGGRRGWWGGLRNYSQTGADAGCFGGITILSVSRLLYFKSTLSFSGQRHSLGASCADGLPDVHVAAFGSVCAPC